MFSDEVSIRLDKPAKVCLACGCVLKKIRGKVTERSEKQMGRAGPDLDQARNGGAVQSTSNDGGRTSVDMQQSHLVGMQEGCKSSELKSRKEARCILEGRERACVERGAYLGGHILQPGMAALMHEVQEHPG